MNRRAFLLLKTTGRRRVLHLSCEALYMRWADARSRAGVATGVIPDDASNAHWDGEPPTEIERETVADVLAELERGLERADAVRLTDQAWLSDPTFGTDVERCLDAYRVRGGTVE